MATRPRQAGICKITVKPTKLSTGGHWQKSASIGSFSRVPVKERVGYLGGRS